MTDKLNCGIEHKRSSHVTSLPEGCRALRPLKHENFAAPASR